MLPSTSTCSCTQGAIGYVALQTAFAGSFLTSVPLISRLTPFPQAFVAATVRVPLTNAVDPTVTQAFEAVAHAARPMSHRFAIGHVIHTGIAGWSYTWIR